MLAAVIANDDFGALRKMDQVLHKGLIHCYDENCVTVDGRNAIARCYTRMGQYPVPFDAYIWNGRLFRNAEAVDHFGRHLLDSVKGRQLLFTFACNGSVASDYYDNEEKRAS